MSRLVRVGSLYFNRLLLTARNSLVSPTIPFYPTVFPSHSHSIVSCVHKPLIYNDIVLRPNVFTGAFTVRKSGS
jgi:hypothetical protein